MELQVLNGFEDTDYMQSLSGCPCRKRKGKKQGQKKGGKTKTADILARGGVPHRRVKGSGDPMVIVDGGQDGIVTALPDEVGPEDASTIREAMALKQASIIDAGPSTLSTPPPPPKPMATGIGAGTSAVILLAVFSLGYAVKSYKPKKTKKSAGREKMPTITI